MTKLTTTQARQGVTGQKVRYVLAASLILSIIGLLIAGAVTV